MSAPPFPVLGLLTSVLLPLVLGIAALTAVDRRGALSWSERIGLAYPCGAVLATVIAYALGHVGMAFTRINFALLSLLPATAFVAIVVRRAFPPGTQTKAVSLNEASSKGSPPYQGGVRGGLEGRGALPPPRPLLGALPANSLAGLLDTPPTEGGYSERTEFCISEKDFPITPSRRGPLTRRIEGQGRICRVKPLLGKEGVNPRLLVATLGSLVLAKILFVVFEVLRRPLTPWDSFSVWSMRAKVWAAQGGLPAANDPFYLATVVRPDYPPHASLLQTWTAIWLGGWNDALINLPWACYYVSGIVLLYGAFRRRMPQIWAMAGAFLLAGLPLYVSQASLAGYADVILSVHFAAAAITTYYWAAEREPVYLALAVLFTASLPFIKLEGMPLALACAGGMIMQMRLFGSTRVRLLLVGSAAAVAVLALWFDVPLRLLLLASAMHREAIWPLLQSFFALGTWHLLWFVLIGVAVLRLRAIWGTPLAWLLATIAAPSLPFLYTFLCTDAAQYALQQTAPARIFLSLAPAALFFTIVAAHEAVTDVGS